MTTDFDMIPRVTYATDGAGLVLLDSSPERYEEVARGGSRALALVEGGAPPTEYLMFGPGVNETVKGPLLFDDEAAAKVVEFYEGRGRKRLAGDWEHDSMVPPEQRAPGYKGSPASHWFALDVRPGPELWAVDVKWTPTAYEQIRNGEYAHTSPVVKFEKSTGRIVAVLSSALTNDPATIGQPQLVAATATAAEPIEPATEVATLPLAATEDKTMAFKMADDAAMKMKALIDGEHADEKEMAGKLKACLSEAMPNHFGEKAAEAGENGKAAGMMADKTTDPAAAAKLSEAAGQKEREADEGGEKREMKALKADLKRLTGKDSPIEIVAVLTAMKMDAERVVTLSAKADQATGAAFSEVLNRARKEMKLTPADCEPTSKTEQGQYIASLRARGEEGVKALSAFVGALKPRVATIETAITEPKTATPDVVTLTAAEEASIRKNGIDRDQYLKNKADRLKAGDAPHF